MQPRRNQRAVTLVELMIVVAIAGVLALAAVPQFREWTSNQSTKDEARGVADLLIQARAEAIRTGVNQIVLLGFTRGGVAMTSPHDHRITAMLARDDNGNGDAETSEIVGSVVSKKKGTISFGHTRAELRAPGDPRGTDSAAPVAAVTFLQDDGTTAAGWVSFFPDGIPRGYSETGFAAGQVGGGSGAVYLTNGIRDFAIVLSPLGGTHVYTWDVARKNWR